MPVPLTLPEPQNPSRGGNDGPVFFPLCTESETTDSVPSDEESAEVRPPAPRGPGCRGRSFLLVLRVTLRAGRGWWWCGGGGRIYGACLLPYRGG